MIFQEGVSLQKGKPLAKEPARRQDSGFQKLLLAFWGLRHHHRRPLDQLARCRRQALRLHLHLHHRHLHRRLHRHRQKYHPPLMYQKESLALQESHYQDQREQTENHHQDSTVHRESYCQDRTAHLVQYCQDY